LVWNQILDFNYDFASQSLDSWNSEMTQNKAKILAAIEERQKAVLDQLESHLKSRNFEMMNVDPLKKLDAFQKSVFGKSSDAFKKFLGYIEGYLKSKNKDIV